MKHFKVYVKYDIDTSNIETIDRFKITGWNRLGQPANESKVKYVGDLCYKDSRIINAIQHIVNRYLDTIINYGSISKIYNYAVLKDLNDKLYSTRASLNNKEYYFGSLGSLNYFIKDNINIQAIKNEICIINYAYDVFRHDYADEDWLVFNVIIFTAKEFIKFVCKPRFVDISFNGRYIGRSIPFTIANGSELKCSLSSKEDEEAFNAVYGSKYHF